MPTFGMTTAQATAANSAMSGGVTYSDYHMLMLLMSAVALVAFLMLILVSAQHDLSEGRSSIMEFVYVILAVAMLLVLFALFLR